MNDDELHERVLYMLTNKNLIDYDNEDDNLTIISLETRLRSTYSYDNNKKKYIFINVNHSISKSDIVWDYFADKFDIDKYCFMFEKIKLILAYNTHPLYPSHMFYKHIHAVNNDEYVLNAQKNKYEEYENYKKIIYLALPYEFNIQILMNFAHFLQIKGNIYINLHENIIKKCNGDVNLINDNIQILNSTLSTIGLKIIDYYSDNNILVLQKTEQTPYPNNESERKIENSKPEAKASKLLDVVAKYEESLHKHSLHDIRVTILTMYQGGRGGDIGFAKLLIKYLLIYQGFKHSNINIVVHLDGLAKPILNNEYFYNVNYVGINGAITPGKENEAVTGWATLQNSNITQDVIELMNKANFCILAPNWYRFTISQLDQIKQTVSNPVFRFTEYDFDIVNSHSPYVQNILKYFNNDLEYKKYPPICLGFGSQMCGILVEQSMIYKPISHDLQELQRIYSVFVCYQHISKNTNQFISINSIGNITTMVTILKSCSMVKNKKIIFWADANPDKLKSGEYQRQHNEIKIDATIITLEQFNESKSVIDSLFNRKNILVVIGGHQQDAFKELNAAAIFGVATGNQSVAELLLNGKLAIYDISRWNEGFLPGLIEALTKAKLTELTNFYKQQNCPNDKQNCVKYLSNVLCDDKKYMELVEQAQNFAKFIITQKNFNSFDFLAEFKNIILLSAEAAAASASASASAAASAAASTEKPAQAKQAQAKPAQAKPAQAKPAQAKPAQENLAQAKQAQAKPEPGRQSRRSLPTVPVSEEPASLAAPSKNSFLKKKYG